MMEGERKGKGKGANGIWKKKREKTKTRTKATVVGGMLGISKNVAMRENDWDACT